MFDQTEYMRKYMARWYQKNKTKIIQTNYARQKKRRQKTKQKAIVYLGGKCCKCGYKKYLKLLEFHHEDPNTKDADICRILDYSWAVIEKELKKCILVCPTCHKEIHYNTRMVQG